MSEIVKPKKNHWTQAKVDSANKKINQEIYKRNRQAPINIKIDDMAIFINDRITRRGIAKGLVRIQEDLNKNLLEVKQEGSKMNIKISDNKDDRIEEIICDYILVQYGQVPSKDNFPIEKVNNLIITKDYYQTSLENVFACGNIITYPGKVANITSGLGEACTIITRIDQIIHPGKNVPRHF